MGISLKVGAGKAYSKLGLLEREMRRLFGKKGNKRYTQKIRDTIARSVAIHTVNTNTFLQEQTPVYSGFLASNWQRSQGKQPPSAIIVAPYDPDDILQDQYNERLDINLDNTDGTKYQIIYNNVEYARSVSTGVNPFSQSGEVTSGGGPDWWYVTGQLFEDSNSYRSAYNQAKREIRL